MKVEPEWLRGYADYLHEDETLHLSAALGYCRQHCQDFTGLDGVLYLYRPALDFLVTQMEQVTSSAQTGLATVQSNLRTSADAYATTDHASADALAASAIDLGEDGESEQLTSYVESDVGCADEYAHDTHVYRDPLEQDAAKVFRDWITEQLDTFGLNDLLKEYLGIDLSEVVLPIVLGNWGAFYRLADAWTEVCWGYRKIGEDIDNGMDVLSTHWDSSDCGNTGASQRFDYHIREEWVPGFEAIDQACVAIAHVCDQMGLLWDTSVNGLMAYLDIGFKALVKEIKRLLSISSVKDLFKNLDDIWQLVEGIVEAIESVIRYFETLAEELVHGFQTWVEIFRLLQRYFGGDFEVFETAA
ncbi:hypothetical protein [Stackebrandtia soli]|uniref:hypothetical protein n=1 Tax=Stackebrandtia soli TaxID=1892856 RepID=UPI0039ED58A1